MEPHELFDEKLCEFINKVAKHDIHTEQSSIAMKNLKTFSECRPPAPAPELKPEPVPTTRWEKFKAGVAGVWNNETTRVFIKAAGAASGVIAVTYATIHKDHVLERQAINQANQRST